MPNSDAELEIALLKDRVAELEQELTTLWCGGLSIHDSSKKCPPPNEGPQLPTLSKVDLTFFCNIIFMQKKVHRIHK